MLSKKDILVFLAALFSTLIISYLLFHLSIDALFSSYVILCPVLFLILFKVKNWGLKLQFGMVVGIILFTAYVNYLN